MSRWSHDEAFPVVARLIRDLHQTKGDFVTHEDLICAFLNDAAGKTLVEAVHEADGGEKSKEWWASNMVQWFSQRITEDRSEYKSQFERKQVKGAWAYRPVP